METERQNKREWESIERERELERERVSEMKREKEPDNFLFMVENIWGMFYLNLRL